MANVLIQDVEVDAKKLLAFIGNAENKVNSVGPGAIAGLATVLGAVGTALGSASAAAAAGGANIALDVATFNSLKAVWPDVVAFAAKFGIKL